MPSWHVALGLAMPGVVVTWLVTGFLGPLAGERFSWRSGLMTVGRTAGHSDVAVRGGRSLCRARRPASTASTCPPGTRRLRLAEAHSQADDREEAARAVQRAHGFVV